MKISDLRPVAGSAHRRDRVGRGHGSGKMKTSGRGQKGQKARTGSSIPAYFEGGQMRLALRSPKFRGFKNPSRVEFATVNLSDLEKIEWDIATEVNPLTLAEHGLIRAKDAKGFVKVLGDGDLTRALKVRAHKFSASARTKIEAAGGKVGELAMPPKPEKTKRGVKTDK